MARPAFKLSAPVVPEQDFHEAVAYLLWRLVLPPARWTCFPAGSVPLPPQFADKLARMGLHRGWPDFLIVHAERVHGLELKRDGEGLSRDRMVRNRRGTLMLKEGQRTTFPQLEEAGMRIAVCTSLDGVMTALRGWGIPTRRTS